MTFALTAYRSFATTAVNSAPKGFIRSVLPCLYQNSKTENAVQPNKVAGFVLLRREDGILYAVFNPWGRPWESRSDVIGAARKENCGFASLVKDKDPKYYAISELFRRRSESPYPTPGTLLVPKYLPTNL